MKGVSAAVRGPRILDGNSVTKNDVATGNGRTLERDARGYSRAEVLSGIGLALLIGVLTFLGIHSRLVTGAVLAKETQEAAIPSVDVVHPSLDAASSEVVLPANVQAFIDTPIYARTSGYLRHWYADIGTHVKQGELLANIETPELDQQVQQAQS